jgi:hypothetical protein
MFTWKWLDQFEAVQLAQMELLSSIRASNAEGIIKDKIINQLNNSFQAFPVEIQLPFEPILLHSNWQFQRTTVGYDLGKVDDLYGSLGNFGLYAAITKWTVKLSPISGKRIAHIHEIGIYMKDTYDFLGNQYLGHWGFESFAISPASGILNSFEVEMHNRVIASKDGECLYAFGNEDYKRYRARATKGGDLLLFSDIKAIPVKLTIPLG